MGCNLSLALLIICLFSASLLGAAQKASADQNVGAPSPGLALYSPTNTTYTSSVVNCSGVLTIPFGEGGGIFYSIDGVSEGTVNWKLNPNNFCGSFYYWEGSFQLPSLPNGSHCLNLTVEDGSLSWVDTVYFTINSSQPIPPTPMPSQTPTDSPNIPELSNLPILLLLITMLFVAVIVSQRKTTSLKR